MNKPFAFALFCALIAAVGCAKRTADTTTEKPTAEAQPEKASPAQMPASMPSADKGPTKGEKPADRGQVDEDGVIRRGFGLTANTVAISVGEGASKAEEYKGKMVKVQGKVSEVCAKKGCWFALTDDAGNVMRITSKGYKFFVPKDAVGKLAVVEGELEVKMLDVATAQHYEDDRVEGTGEKAKKVTEPQRSVSVAAIGLEMKDS
jgi:hypothetical protein